MLRKLLSSALLLSSLAFGFQFAFASEGELDENIVLYINQHTTAASANWKIQYSDWLPGTEGNEFVPGCFVMQHANGQVSPKRLHNFAKALRIHSQYDLLLEKHGATSVFVDRDTAASYERDYYAETSDGRTLGDVYHDIFGDNENYTIQVSFRRDCTIKTSAFRLKL